MHRLQPGDKACLPSRAARGRHKMVDPHIPAVCLLQHLKGAVHIWPRLKSEVFWHIVPAGEGR